MNFSMGKLDFVPATSLLDLLGETVAAALTSPQWPHPADAIGVAEIDPSLSDTAAFCEQYDILATESANCVVISGKREGETRFAACVVLATTRADVNSVARRALDVRKASFAATDVATAQTGMEYGGITPIGLPTQWPILVDAAVAAAPQVIIGSGVRRSKLALSGQTLANLPGTVVVEGLAR